LLVPAAFCAVGVLVYLGQTGKKRQSAPSSLGTATPRKGEAAKPATVLSVEGQGKHGRKGTGEVQRVVAGGVSTNKLEAAKIIVRTEDERKAATMRELLDGGSEKEALRMARVLMGSPEKDVRSQVVTVLGWIGMRALPELTHMLSDEEEGIASDAFTQWKMAFGEIQDNALKAELLVSAFGVMTSEEDMESLGMSFSELPEDMAVRSLIQIIQSGNPMAGEVAREQFAFITQTDYTTREAADQWIRENVETNKESPQP
jgi:hypothetical protein